MIKGLHHNAYRCRDSEQTRQFYEDFLGLPLAGTLRLEATVTGRRTDALHTFYELGDGSYLAFSKLPICPSNSRTSMISISTSRWKSSATCSNP
jgi:catechol 2,3-dioxygenase-like lactoylglutathione lyase family enzyme